jgi:hypothetical protein
MVDSIDDYPIVAEAPSEIDAFPIVGGEELQKAIKPGQALAAMMN